ncbi:MAG: transketolase family protein [Bacteroidales bacterium]|nr:transketolase family protein [Bacteroidales bacterium]
MVGVAAGLAITGKVPFAGSFAEFITGRVYDQIRQEVAYGHTNVKLASSHAGITLGEDGATHQTMEDIALMRALPGMVVINPCDFNQTKNATIAAAKYNGPVYLRFGRPSVPNFTPEDEPFEIGKAYVMNEGKDVTIIATGHLVWEALQAAEALEAEGICAEVINVATIKPLDEATIVTSALKTKGVVVAEEHNSAGGLGELVAGVLARRAPTPMEMVNGGDRFGQSGTPKELMAAYGLDAEHIAKAAKKVMNR